MRLLKRISETREFLVKDRKRSLPEISANDNFIASSVLISFLLLLIQSLFLLLVYRSLPSELPIFYSHPYGEKQLAARYMLWLLPLLSLICYIFNLFLTKKISSHKTLGRILTMSSLFLLILLLITQLKIITS